MASTRRIALRRKLHILRSFPSNFKSVKRSTIINNVFLYTYMLKLKLKLEAVKREFANLMAIREEYLNQMSLTQYPHVPNMEVKVEKIEEGFLVKLKCEKGEDTLVSVLQVLEEMGLQVLQATVSCDNLFAMEATTMSQNLALDARDIIHALVKAATQKLDDKQLVPKLI